MALWVTVVVAVVAGAAEHTEGATPPDDEAPPPGLWFRNHTDPNASGRSLAGVGVLLSLMVMVVGGGTADDDACDAESFLPHDSFPFDAWGFRRPFRG